MNKPHIYLDNGVWWVIYNNSSLNWFGKALQFAEKLQAKRNA